LRTIVVEVGLAAEKDPYGVGGKQKSEEEHRDSEYVDKDILRTGDVSELCAREKADHESRPEEVRMTEYPAAGEQSSDRFGAHAGLPREGLRDCGQKLCLPISADPCSFWVL